MGLPWLNIEQIIIRPKSLDTEVSRLNNVDILQKDRRHLLFFIESDLRIKASVEEKRWMMA